MAIVGISGSPIVDGNTDRMVRSILEQSGKDHIFINLSKLKFDPCRACAHLCAKTNLCPLKDDLEPYFEPIRDAEALVLGTSTNAGNMTAWMFSFLSRLWCFHHVKRLLRDKPVVLVATGLFRRSEARVIPKFRDAIKSVNVLGHVFFASEIPPCYRCGAGKECKVGGLWHMLGKDEEKLKNFRLTKDMFYRWEDCQEAAKNVEKYADVLSRLGAAVPLVN